jgi:hypothetical protein
MRIVKRINHGEMIPPFYGIAWVEYPRPEAVCLPVPLNMLAGMAREFWIFLKHGWRRVHTNPRMAYYQGIKDGEKVTRIECCKRCGWYPGMQSSSPWNEPMENKQ